MTISATIPADVVGRTTIHDGEDFLLVGASDNGDTAPMVRWDSRNSRWIELEVSKKWGKINEEFYKKDFLADKIQEGIWGTCVS